MPYLNKSGHGQYEYGEAQLGSLEMFLDVLFNSIDVLMR